MIIEKQLTSFPQLVQEASIIKERVSLKGINKIIIAGIGGSGIAGNLLRDYLLDKLEIPIITVNNIVPRADRKTLAFIVSYSGNTRETIKIYQGLKKQKSKIVVFTSGGKLGKSREKKILIPKGFEPRMTIPFQFFAMLTLLGKGENVDEVLKVIRNFQEEDAEGLVDELLGVTPIIYSSSEKLKTLAYKWKTDLNETSKIPAFCNYFTEINHNEIEAEIDYDDFSILLLGEADKEVEKALKIIKAEKIELKGKTELARLFYGLLLGEYISYYLAKLKKKDPEATPNIDKLHG
ncbi:MAG: bifunctional phosphoglucose/phosphomannose isomerase [archaeon]